VSKTSLEVFNYLVKLDDKYEILNKAKASLEEAANKLKSSPNVDPEALDKVEKALATTTSKIEEINEEYDLVGGGVTALGVIGDLVEKAINKAGELNEEYNLTTKAKEALSAAVEKGKEAAKKASSA
jgi:chromosome segregation ATPase